MIRRIDLRGAAAAAVDYRARGAARRLRRRGRAGGGAADLRRRPGPRGRGDRGVLRPLRRRRADRHRGAAGGPAGRAGRRSTPTCAPGSRSRSAGCGSTCEAELEHDVVTDLGRGARVTQRLVPVDRVGLYVPGGVAPLVSSVVMNVVPAQVAGVGSIALTSSAAEGPRRAPAPDDPGRLRAARHRRGVRRRRCPGDRDVRLRRRAVPPGRPGHRAGQHLHRLRQAAAQGRRRHRLRGRSDRDRDPGRRHRRRGVRRRRPGQPGRARPDGRLGAGHRLAAAGRRGRGRARQAGRRRPGTSSGSAPRCPASSPASCSSTTSSRASTWSTPTPPSTSRSRPRTPPRGAARVRNAGAVFVGPWAPVSLGDYCAGSNHVLPTAGCACHSSGLSVRSFLRVGARRRVLPRRRSPRSPTTWSTLADAEDLPGHGAAVAASGSQ